MKKKTVRTIVFSIQSLVIGFVALLVYPDAVLCQESLCARVKIEIRQEATLERQGFEAHMRVSNGFTDRSMEDVDVDVYFQNENGETVSASSDPDDDQALFFIQVDRMTGIDDIDGAGIVEPSGTADIYWLIVPAPGASNGNPQGDLYYVGASMRYAMAGDEQDFEIAPDFIFVKPMPELVLDYFLTREVYGDDAFTAEIEPSIPFTLGVMARNDGAGTAKEFVIDSVQPEIVENEQGLLIGFAIEETYANGVPARTALRAELGDIGPGAAAVARWIMTCSLSGEFVELAVNWSHADELGGRLTSLIETVESHYLIRDVLVDLPGRDAIRDFLADDDGTLRVYESDNVITVATDQSEFSHLTFSSADGDEAQYDLVAPTTAGFLFAKLADPFGGQKVLTGTVRSDGKHIRADNCWLSQTRDDDNNWQYFVNLFDATSSGRYSLTFDDPSVLPRAPVLQFIPDRTIVAGVLCSFIVEATDADGTVPSLTATPLPVGATFTDQNNGTGTFSWIPAAGQGGLYKLAFTASDGDLSAVRYATLTVFSGADADNDNMPDAWEELHFGDTGRDGTLDFDGDGVSDYDEYLNGTDPALFMGDFNDDNIVDLADAVLATQILAGSIPESVVDIKAAVSESGKIGVIDIVYVLRHVSGAI